MLPTKGYFQDIECPYNNSLCGRPYCHFRHKKKITDNAEEIVTEPEKEESTVIPTYKPTPKSELANIHSKSHIPISYVPDLTFRPERKIRPLPKIEKPTYKPTPLSILSSANNRLKSVGDENGDNIEAINEIKQNIANMAYDPATSLQPAEDIDFEGLDSEFAIIDEIIRSTDYKKKKKPFRVDSFDNGETIDDGKTKSSEETKSELLLEDLRTEQNNDSQKTLTGNKNEDKAELEKNKKDGLKDKDKEIKSERSSDKKKEHNEEKKKDSVSDKNKKYTELKIVKNSEKMELLEKKQRKEIETKKTENKPKENFDQTKSSEKIKTCKDDKRGKEKTEKNNEKSLKSLSKDKHRKEELKDRKDKTDKNKEKSRSHTKSRSRSRERAKSKEKNSNKQRSKEKITPKHNRDRSAECKSTKNENDERQKSRQKIEEKRGGKEHSRERRKSKERSEDRRKSKEHIEDRNKTKEKLKESSDTSRGKHKHDSKTDKSSSKIKLGSSKDKKKHISSEESVSDSDRDILIDQEIDDSLMEMDLDENVDETLLECYKIFNEYKPTPKNTESASESEMFSPEYSSRDSTDLGINEYSGKKRIAHSTIDRTYSQLHPPEKPKSVVTPGQILTNRYKLAKMAQANREQELLMKEIQQPVAVKRPAPSLLEAARARKIRKEQTSNHFNTNIVDDILKGSSNKTSLPAPRPKIAPAQNVSLMAKAKERLSKIAQAPPKTIAQTQKTPRVAHVPDISLADIPNVLQAEKSKLPVNVRTRFLTLLADESVKMYVSKEEAFSRALNEEYACYEKCKVLATYRNSAMLAVNRLRKEIQERNSNGLGLIGVGEDVERDSEAEYKGKSFYNKVKKWILTEEELDIHGYPRESEDCHGKAKIKNRQILNNGHLDENQRLCCRCKKVYLVDDDGWPLYEEECLYHPMKKRTIRGEQTYLCCRSSGDIGCATSDTHVSEGFSSADLEGFQTTLDPESEDDPRNYAVFALDCEMCYTTKGLELTRVTIVDSDCKTVYESLVKPLNPIIDYNTRFSGITKEQMDRTSTSILQVQANILHLCNSNTILVGHSLESDMKALKIVHGTVIDTSVLFPHKMGLPHKRALKALASEYLRKIIQNDVSGHDSAEDAVTCMELLKWKLKEEIRSRPSK